MAKITLHPAFEEFRYMPKISGTAQIKLLPNPFATLGNLRFEVFQCCIMNLPPT